MPAAWPEASLTDVRVLDGKLSIRYARQDKGYTLTLSERYLKALERYRKECEYEGRG